MLVISESSGKSSKGCSELSKVKGWNVRVDGGSDITSVQDKQINKVWYQKCLSIIRNTVTGGIERSNEKTFKLHQLD